MGRTASAAAALAAAEVMEGPPVGPPRVEERQADTTPGSALERDWNVFGAAPDAASFEGAASLSGGGGADCGRARVGIELGCWGTGEEILKGLNDGTVGIGGFGGAVTGAGKRGVGGCSWPDGRAELENR